MNGLEFARCTPAGDFSRVLVHAAPGKLSVRVTGDDDDVVLVRGDVDRTGDYSPITLLELGPPLLRSEVWPGEDLLGLPVLLPGGEVGVLTAWEHAPDHSWWRWSVGVSNHVGRQADWAPPGQQPRP